MSLTVEEAEYTAEQLVKYALVLAAMAANVDGMDKESQMVRRQLTAECRELRRMAKKLRGAQVPVS